jgi:streptomycin 3"-adenylyltransferase
VGLAPRESIDHSPGRSQQWANVDADIADWTGNIVERLGQLEDLVGVYLHGSLAMGGFHRPKSDVDLLVVTDSPLTDEDRSALADDIVRLFDRRPIVGGVELSVMQRVAASEFLHPAPYEFHFSETWADEARRGGSGPRGTDPDLAAHCTVVRSRGITLAGPTPREAFGEVPRWAYVDAVLDDLGWIIDGGVLKSPFYGILNICRCAFVLLGDPGEPPSKVEGAEWALDHLPSEHHAVIADALSCYTSAAWIDPSERRHHGHRWDEEALLDIASWARRNLPTAVSHPPSRS